MTPSQRLPPGLSDCLGELGLSLRGGFVFADGEDAPAGPAGAPAKSLLLIGNGGGAMWREFSAWLDRQPDIMADPLDSWTVETIGGLAAHYGARAVYPNDRPWHPFQRWAMRAEGLKASPLGVLMHPEYGLWHAYRAALLFDVELSIQAPQAMNHPCDQCVDQPCLTACPVGAYSLSGFDAAACAAHLRSADIEERPHGGCSARNACPVGAAYRYAPAQQAFHKRAFMRARG
ncbi:MAG: 4Fe-4S dicluster domain-containing protein [Phyllobacteriaceae bacterium]|nr:4Fe-4S dicluster domain-containing protein [Phyllobacteriaceae bacterium]